MRHERYIIDEQEIELLEKYEEITCRSKDPNRYDGFDRDVLAEFCRMKDRSNDIYFKRTQAARDVIDMIAKLVGIDPEDTALWLYATDSDGSSPILNRIGEWISRSGDKAQLKKRVQELEAENALLRSLIRK